MVTPLGLVYQLVSPVSWRDGRRNSKRELSSLGGGDTGDERVAMTISPEAKQKVQLFLVAAMVITGVRAAYIIYQRRSENAAQTKKAAAPPLNADYYVTPKKLYPYDLKSARQLTKQPVWVKEGYRYTYYPYNPATKKVDFGSEAGTLAPIEKLDIKDVITDVAPGAGGRQVLAVFEDGGKKYAVPVGTAEGGNYH